MDAGRISSPCFNIAVWAAAEAWDAGQCASGWKIYPPLERQLNLNAPIWPRASHRRLGHAEKPNNTTIRREFASHVQRYPAREAGILGALSKSNGVPEERSAAAA
jgi:hypothetical protein